MVLLLLIVAVIPAWSAPALPDCCVRAVKTSTSAEAKHGHCAGMSMGAESAPKHNHNNSGTTILSVQANCRCTMATVGIVVAPLPVASEKETLPAVKTAAAFHRSGFKIRLIGRNHSERGPPALLQSQS